MCMPWFGYLQISGEFRQLKPVLQEVIADITEKMGSGMTVFLQSKVDTMAEWDEVKIYSLTNSCLCMFMCSLQQFGTLTLQTMMHKSRHGLSISQ